MNSPAAELLQTDEFTDEQHVPQPSRYRLVAGALSIAVVVILGLVVLMGVDNRVSSGAALGKATELDSLDCAQTCSNANDKLSQCMSTCSTDCTKCKPLQDAAMKCASNCDPRLRCASKCQARHDPSCMQTCEPKMAKCMQAKCLQTTDHESCGMECKTTACGKQCLYENQLFQGCMDKCHTAEENSRDSADPSSTQNAYMMSAEGKCHQRCGKQDAAQMACVNGCMPKVQECSNKMCAKYKPGTSEQTSCSQTCQKECRDTCSELLHKAQNCHESCVPEGRTKCLNDCQSSYDDSCMHECGPKAGKCLLNCSRVATQVGFSECQKKCDQDSCGKECLEISTKKQTCTSACYANASPDATGASSSAPQVGSNSA